MTQAEVLAVLVGLAILIVLRVMELFGWVGAPADVRRMRAAFLAEVARQQEREDEQIAAARQREEAARARAELSEGTMVTKIESIRGPMDGQLGKIWTALLKLQRSLPAAVAEEVVRREGNGGPRSQREPARRATLASVPCVPLVEAAAPPDDAEEVDDQAPTRGFRKEDFLEAQKRQETAAS